MAPSQLKIATGALERLVKEEASYHKEMESQKVRISNLEQQKNDQDENREFMLKQEVTYPYCIRNLWLCENQSWHFVWHITMPTWTPSRWNVTRATLIRRSTAKSIGRNKSNLPIITWTYSQCQREVTGTARYGCGWGGGWTCEEGSC